MLQFGEIPEDVYYFNEVLGQDVSYSSMMLNQGISDYENEQQVSFIDQNSSLVEYSGLQDLNFQVNEPLNFLSAGFVGDNWPVLAILGIGLLLALRKGKPDVHTRRRKKRHGYEYGRRLADGRRR